MIPLGIPLDVQNCVCVHGNNITVIGKCVVLIPVIGKCVVLIPKLQCDWPSC